MCNGQGVWDEIYLHLPPLWIRIFAMTDNPSLYELMGGEAGLRALVKRFYDIMDSAPETAKIRSLHLTSLDNAREKLFMFLSGWSGGPPLYMEKIGQPRLRLRHLPFLIGDQERNEWLWCMGKALDETSIPGETIEMLKERFGQIADNMRNRPIGL